ncbi:hypothetical protein [Glaciihabitans tibetensis]|nr:hypothetical protein [Glaciihabitans tibetensis]
MTLTRMIPSLRRSLPDPLSADLWPEATVATVTDVVVSGISLLRLVEVCGTPCVHSGAAVVPRTGGRPSTTDRTTVLVVRVTSVEHAPSGPVVVRTDARLDDPALIWLEARLIGRVSTAHNGLTLVACRPLEPDAGTGTNGRAADLPQDVRAGDLLAIPSEPARTSFTFWTP